nr:(Fe-S)-binding protein [Desulfobacterales bacterium]
MDDVDVDTEFIKETLKALKGARFKAWLQICAHCGLCADSCLFYLAHDKDPKYMPSYKVAKTLGKLYKRKGKVDRGTLEEMAEILYGNCTLCRRCAMYCPFGIDIAIMMSAARIICCSQGLAPDGLKATIENVIKTGNQMGMSTEDFIETCEWMAEETEEDLPGLQIPIDKDGAEMMYTVNAREPQFYPQDIAEAAMIFHVAGEDWTLPSVGWDCTNLAMFAGDTKTMAKQVKLVYDAAERLGVKKIGITECGHAYRACRFEGPYWLGFPGGEPPVPVVHSVELFARYVREGRIKIDPAKRVTEPVTYQDPCNISRSGGLAEEARYLVNALCTDFREMEPNREHNHCCGGGGGYMPMGPRFKKRRLESGRIKAEQIRETGAKIVIVPCHNCFDQIRDLDKEYDLGVKVVHFKTLISQMMIIPDDMKPNQQAS